MTAETRTMNLSLATTDAAEAPAESDESLVHRLRDGETAAGETLVKRYHQSLMRYLQRLTRSDHVAEELHQQTWLSVLDHLDRFDAGSSSGGFKAWLFRIATNKANDLWRSRGREKNAKERLKLGAGEERPRGSFRVQGNEEGKKIGGGKDALPANKKK